MAKEAAFRPGKKISEYNPVPLMLSQKTYRRFNLLIGEDYPQQRLAEQILGIPCVFTNALTDRELLVDDQPKLFRLFSSSSITISPQVKDQTSFWSLDPIEKGSAGANAIVRYAATLLEMDKPDKDVVERIADRLAASGTINDIRVALWTSVWLLTGSVPPESKRWPQPWESLQFWFNIPGVSPEHRLHTLYIDMTAYALIQGDEEITLKKAGLKVSPSKVKFFKSLKLDFSKVHDTISILDVWRTKRSDPYICAFCISRLWEK